MANEGAEGELERRVPPVRRRDDLLRGEELERLRLFHEFIDALPEGIVSLNLDGTVLTWSRGAEKILGYSEADAAGASASRLLDFNTEWWALGRDRWEGPRQHQDGRSIQVSIRSMPVVNHEDRLPLGFIWIVRDVTEQVHHISFLHSQQTRLLEDARTDPLTGVANRRRLEEVLRAEISRAKRQGAKLSLMLIDLDHLKVINDRHNHAVGDAAIKAFAAAVQTQLRAGDLLARIGGDEFVLLMPATDRDEARACANRVREALGKVRLAGLPQGLTSSFGISEYRDGDSGEVLLGRADRALYGAKQNGRDCVVHSDDGA